METKNGMETYSRLAVNSLFAEDPSWLWVPGRELEAVRLGEWAFVRSRSREGVVHRVNLLRRTCTCKGFQFYGRCWHLEAAEMAAVVREVPEWAARVCAGCNHVIYGFMVFRENDRAANWGGGKTIAPYCLDCARHKREVDEIMDGMGLY